MWRWTRRALVPAIAVLVVSCGTSTEMVESWREPEFKPKPVKKVLIVGIGENELRVKVFEDIMSQKFAARKLDVLRGLDVIPRSVENMDAVKEAVRASGADLAITSRFLGMEKETQYVPGSSYYVPGPTYYGMYSYYPSAYAVASDPGYFTTYKVYKIESNVYDVKTEKLIWSGQSHTTDPVNPEDGINSFGNTLVGELVRFKIIK